MPNSTIEREIRVQRRIVRALRREIFGVDKTNRSRYIRDFHSELRSYLRVCTREEVIERALRSDIVYFGDYHPLDASQTLALELLAALTGAGAQVVLALEVLYEHQQETLDRWMKGTISEKEFLKAIDYDSEWGFNWESFRRLFDAARDPFVPIFGLDSPPRDQLRFIRRRDRMIARRIETIRGFFPAHIVFVVVGESHLATGHLPAQVRRLAGPDVRETTIVQNIDELAWRLLREGHTDAGAVEVAEGRFCVFTASPIVKYQAYLQTLERWSEGSDCDITTPAFVELVEGVFFFLLGAERPEVTLGEDWREPVRSAYPEVLCGSTYQALLTDLRTRSVTQSGALAAHENLRDTGITYVPVVNAVFSVRYDPACAAVEAARFVLYALRDEIGRFGRVRRRLDDRFYAFVIEEALCRVGARLVDPALDFGGSAPLLSLIDGRCALRTVAGRLPGLTPAETRETVELLRYHRRRESSAKREMRPTPMLRRIHRFGIRKRLWIVKALGSRLGDALYRGFHEGTVPLAELRALFHERFEEPGAAQRAYLELVRLVRIEQD